MKILFLWHAAADPNNRALLDEAIAHPGFEITVLATRSLDDRLRRWTLRAPIVRRHPRSGSWYRIIPARALFPRSLGYHLYLAFPWHLLRARPDLIHVHAETASLAATQAVFWRRLLAPRARLVVHPYQNLYVDYTWPWPLLERLVLRAADAMVAGNPGAARVLARRRFAGPVHVLRTLGAYARVFRPGRPSPWRARMPRGVPVIGWTGRMFLGKGLHLLLAACARLRRPYHLFIVGDGPQRDALHAQAGRLGLTRRITWAGAVSPDRVAETYAAMDVYATPTIDAPPDMPTWKEQCPRAQIEAMLSGLAIVAADSGENAWTLDGAAVIIPQRSVAALTTQLDRLLGSVAARRSLGRKARTRALRYWTWERAAADLARIWRTFRP